MDTNDVSHGFCWFPGHVIVTELEPPPDGEEVQFLERLTIWNLGPGHSMMLGIVTSYLYDGQREEIVSGGVEELLTPGQPRDLHNAVFFNDELAKKEHQERRELLELYSALDMLTIQTNVLTPSGQFYVKALVKPVVTYQRTPHGFIRLRLEAPIEIDQILPDMRKT